MEQLRIPDGVRIALTKGKYAFVSHEDSFRVLQSSWASTQPNKNQWYAVARIHKKNLYLHRFIMGVTDPKVQVDHEDGNGLNCLRTNLRLATNAQNQMNRRSKKEFKGVYFYKRTGLWMSQIKLDSKLYFLGYYSTPQEAARVYDARAKQLFGEFAHLNFKE